jgi:hypothetical protein
VVYTTVLRVCKRLGKSRRTMDRPFFWGWWQVRSGVLETDTDRSSDSPSSASVYLSHVLGLNMTVSPRLALERRLTGVDIGA